MVTLYDRSIHQLDLCIFAYQLYAQTLLWPMDPFSEEMARKRTHRRETFLAERRRRFADRRVPAHLDPILTDPGRVDPHRAALFKPESDGRWSVFDTPRIITDRIGATYLASSGGDGIDLLPADHRDASAGPDTLYCFEGITGERKGRPGHGSLLGYVLERDLDSGPEAGGYDVHVVFRGARSGWVMRSAARGLLGLRGNPDWTTAMDRGLQAEHPTISGRGRSSRGFATAMAASLPSIVACLDAIDRPNPPRRIHVAGHSLGGALAAHFASAILLNEGEPVGARPTEEQSWRSWRWDNVHLSTFGAPTVGDHTFRESLERLITADRYLIDGDPVTSAPIDRWGVHIGRKLALAPPGHHQGEGARWWSRRSPVSRDHHEPALIRRALVEHANAEGRDLTGVPAAAGTDEPDEPWKDYNSLAAVLAEHPRFRNHPWALGATLPDLGRQMTQYLEIAAWVLGRRRAHPFFLKGRRDRRLTVGAVEQVIEAIDVAERDPSRPAESEKVMARVRDALNDDRLHRFLGLCLALTHLTGEAPPPLGDLGTLNDGPTQT